MKYIIQEIQTNAEGITAFVPPAQTDDRNEADSIFYARASAAAISNVTIHTVTLETNEGFQLMPPVCYKHYPPDVPEESEEPEETQPE